MAAAIGRIDGAKNARELPYKMAIMKIGNTPVGSVDAYHARSSADASSPVIASWDTRLRLYRSATVPVTKTSSAIGKNSANPSQPRSSSRFVMSYTCLASVVTCNDSPTYKRMFADIYAATDGARNISSNGARPDFLSGVTTSLG